MRLAPGPDPAGPELPRRRPSAPRRRRQATAARQARRRRPRPAAARRPGAGRRARAARRPRRPAPATPSLPSVPTARRRRCRRRPSRRAARRPAAAARRRRHRQQRSRRRRRRCRRCPSSARRPAATRRPRPSSSTTCSGHDARAPPIQRLVVANPVLVGAVTTLVIVVAVFLAYNANNGLPFVPTRQLDVLVSNGANLVKGNEVRSGGFRVGVVDRHEAGACCPTARSARELHAQARQEGRRACRSTRRSSSGRARRWA